MHTTILPRCCVICHMKGFVWESYGQGSREYLVWYVLFIVFVTYAMLPLPLRWCILAGCSTALLHILITSYTKSSKEKVIILTPVVYRARRTATSSLVVYDDVCHRNFANSIAVQLVNTSRIRTYS